jgi:hypothetical protein
MDMAGSSRRPRVLLAVTTCTLACVVALLAGCGSTSSKTTTSTAAGSLTPSSSSPTSAAPSASPASESQLAKIVLQPSDLPPDWTPTPYKAEPGDTAAQAALLRCLGVLSTASDKVAEAHSFDFTLGDARVSSSASSYRSQTTVDAYIAALHSSKVSPCLEQRLKREITPQLPAGATIESVSVKITPGPAGPANVVGDGVGTVKISVSGEHGVIYLRVAYITGPLIWAEVDGSNVGAPLPAPLWESLESAVADRADQA